MKRGLLPLLAALVLAACADAPPLQASLQDRGLALTVSELAVEAGSAVTVSVVVYDEYGAVDLGYRGTVAIETTDADAVLDLAHTFSEVDAGRAEWVVELRSAGRHVLRARDVVDSDFHATTDVWVTPGPAAVLTVEALRGEVVAGEAVDLTFEAHDAFGNPTGRLSGPLTFSSYDELATLPEDQTMDVQIGGAWLLPRAAILRTAGTQIIEVASVDSPGLSDSVTLRVEPAQPVEFVVTGSETSQAGQPADLGVSVNDRYGNRVESYGGTVNFLSSDPKASLPEPHTFSPEDAGLVMLRDGVVLPTAGMQSVTVVDAVDPNLRGSVSTEVVRGSLNPQATALSLDTTARIADGQDVSEIAVRVMDAYGNPIPGIHVIIDVQGSENTLEPSHGLSGEDGQFTAQLRSTVAERKVITAWYGDDVSTFGADAPMLKGEVTFVAGPAAYLDFSIHPSVLTPGEPGYLGVAARDGHDNLVQDWNGTVTVSSDDPQVQLPEPFEISLNPAVSPTVRQATFPAAGEYVVWAASTTDNLIGRAQVTVEPGILGEVGLVQETEAAGETGNVWIDFETGSPWPEDGRVGIVFPEGYDLTSATVLGATGTDGIFEIASIDGAELSLQRQGGTAVDGGTTVTVGIGGVRNPWTTDFVDGLVVTTRLLDGRVIERGEAAAIDIRERVFTHCGRKGRIGPTQDHCDGTYEGTLLDGEVSVSGGIQSWVVPSTGAYRIEAFGAQGGAGRVGPGGAGAWTRGDFELEAGQTLRILIGQQGGDGGSVGGGGGGTFVWVEGESLPLVVAGGGGGAGRLEEGTISALGGVGLSEEDGGDGAQSRAPQDGGTAKGGSAGGGGTHGTFYTDFGGGAGGAGWFEDGSPSTLGWCEAASGGLSPLQGGEGGFVWSSGSGSGGFGGGGAGRGACTWAGGGGGGGFSGGGGGGGDAAIPDGGSTAGGGGGGGSYNAGLNRDDAPGIGFGAGRVSIRPTEIDAS